MEIRRLKKTVVLASLIAGIGTCSLTGCGRKEVNDNYEYGIVKESHDLGIALDAYNNYLKRYDIVLTDKDIEYLASLNEEKDLVCVKSIYDYYNYFRLGRDLVIISDERLRLANIINEESFYSNILVNNFASMPLTEEDLKNSIPVEKFLEMNGIQYLGYCVPTFPIFSEDALKEICEIYGEEVA